jgi:hypothetical protein
MRFCPPFLIIGAWLLATIACASDPSQGWSTRSTFREDIKTVAVPVLVNDTYYRDVGFQLTDALIKEIQRNTPYRVASQKQADSILLGRVTEVELDRLSKSKLTGLSEEVILSVTIDFEWKDRRTGETLVSRRSFMGSALFVPSRSNKESPAITDATAREPIELGEFAAVQLLARDVVAELEATW